MNDALETNVAVNDKPPAVIGNNVWDIDFLGKASRVHSVASLLQNAQAQLQQLQHVMLLNQKTLDDAVDLEEGKLATYTYRERIELLTSGMSALISDNEDIKDELIAEAVTRRKLVERNIEKEIEESS